MSKIVCLSFLLQMTPEILRNARKALQMKKTAGASAAATTSGAPSSSTSTTAATSSRGFKEQLQAHRNMAASRSTHGLPAARSAGALPLKVAPLPVFKPMAPTNPQPFKFATDSRVKPNSDSHQHQPNSESSREVDFLKMLRTYKPAGASV